MNKESENTIKWSDATVQWRCVLRLIVSALPSVASITIGTVMDGSCGSEKLERFTAYTVHWKQWDEVFRGFKHLTRVSSLQLSFGTTRTQQYAEPYQPWGRLPKWFGVKMKEVVTARLPEAKKRGLLVFV